MARKHFLSVSFDEMFQVVSLFRDEAGSAGSFSLNAAQLSGGIADDDGGGFQADKIEDSRIGLNQELIGVEFTLVDHVQNIDQDYPSISWKGMPGDISNTHASTTWKLQWMKFAGSGGTGVNLQIWVPPNSAGKWKITILGPGLLFTTPELDIANYDSNDVWSMQVDLVGNSGNGRARLLLNGATTDDAAFDWKNLTSVASNKHERLRTLGGSLITGPSKGGVLVLQFWYSWLDTYSDTAVTPGVSTSYKVHARYPTGDSATMDWMPRGNDCDATVWRTLDDTEDTADVLDYALSPNSGVNKDALFDVGISTPGVDPVAVALTLCSRNGLNTSTTLTGLMKYDGVLETFTLYEDGRNNAGAGATYYAFLPDAPSSTVWNEDVFNATQFGWRIAKSGDSGTYNSVGTLTLTDTSKSWNADEWRGYTCSRNGVRGEIIGNTDKELTIVSGWYTDDESVETGDNYSIQAKVYQLVVHIGADDANLARLSAVPCAIKQAVAGTLTATGSLANKTKKVVAGALSLVGALATVFSSGGELFLQAVAGALSLSGTVSRKPLKALAGTLSGAGSLARKTMTALAGALSGVGTIARKPLKALAGALSGAGELTTVRLFFLAVAGALSGAGVLTRKSLRPIGGTISAAGTLSRLTLKAMTGALTFVGSLVAVRKFFLAIAGALNITSDGGGGFPVVADITLSEFAVSTTEHLVDMPATVDAGDLLLVFFNADGSPTVTTPTGWTLMDNGEGPGGNNVFSVYYKDAVGDEDGTTVDFVTSATEQAVAQVYRITAASWHGTTAPEISTAVIDTSAIPDPADLNPSGWDVENTLWIASYGADDQEDATAYPTNYTDGTYNESWTGSGSCGVGTARRELATASENPSTFTINASQQWVAFTVAIRPAGGGGGLVRKTLKQVAGSLTGVGSLSRTAMKAVAGALAGAGGLARKTLKPLAGTLAFTGALATARLYFRAFAGAVTLTSTQTRKTLKAVAGALSLVGAVATNFISGGTQFTKAVAGSLALSGGQTIKILKAVIGALAASGATVRKTLTSIAGTLALTGAIARVTKLAIAGALSFVGALATDLITGGTEFTKAVAGSLAASGALTRKPLKVLVGSLSLTGTLARAGRKVVAGVLSNTGTLTTIYIQTIVIGGTLALSGAITRSTQKTLSGALVLSGVIAISVAKIVLGSLSLAGGLTKRVLITILGALAIAGALSKKTMVSVIGALSLSGAVLRKTLIFIAGALALTSTLSRLSKLIISGTLIVVGTVETATTIVIVRLTRIALKVPMVKRIILAIRD